MTNHFTDLGFNVIEARDLAELIVQCASEADEIPLDSGGSLLRWGVGAGIELWIQVHPSGELVAAHPFFLGPSRIQFKITRLDVLRDGVEDGALMGWVSPNSSTDDDFQGAYPMRFDLPAYPCGTENLKEGGVCELQIAAFADEIAVYRDEKEFNEAQDAETQFSVHSFVPLGLIPPEDDDDDDDDPFGEGLLHQHPNFQPIAEALFSGDIQRCELRINPFTRNPFWWLQVRAHQAEFDVVTDPALLDSDPREGDIVQGHFWMAARITD